MKEVILTNDRLFMSMFGRWVFGKTQQIFSMLLSPTTFNPPVGNTYYFYKDYQPLFEQLSEKLEHDFLPCLDFEENQ